VHTSSFIAVEMELLDKVGGVMSEMPEKWLAKACQVIVDISPTVDVQLPKPLRIRGNTANNIRFDPDLEHFGC
jgi:hypothetical protein